MKKRNQKIVQYDREADVLSLYVKQGREEEFIELAPGVSVELDTRGNVIGVEILNASSVLRSFVKSAKKRAPAYAR
ncbi:MAG: DUF2283 domain-containing protein [bacterium]|nr:DUF2283 domain-containing protein [bacterium]